MAITPMGIESVSLASRFLPAIGQDPPAIAPTGPRRTVFATTPRPKGTVNIDSEAKPCPLAVAHRRCRAGHHIANGERAGLLLASIA